MTFHNCVPSGAVPEIGTILSLGVILTTSVGGSTYAIGIEVCVDAVVRGISTPNKAFIRPQFVVQSSIMALGSKFKVTGVGTKEKSPVALPVIGSKIAVIGLYVNQLSLILDKSAPKASRKPMP